MTIEFLPLHRHADSLAKCDDCQHVCRCGDLNPIRDPGERLDDGSPIPSGECPECGALSYRQHAAKIWGCETCGCTDAEQSAWIHCNTELVSDGDGPAHHDWCPQCEHETTIVPVDKLKPYGHSEPEGTHYFALADDGLLYDLCNCGDMEAAEESAADLDIKVVWIADEAAVRQWQARIAAGLTRS